jgi:hypothetical protein
MANHFCILQVVSMEPFSPRAAAGDSLGVNNVLSKLNNPDRMLR